MLKAALFYSLLKNPTTKPGVIIFPTNGRWNEGLFTEEVGNLIQYVNNTAEDPESKIAIAMSDKGGCGAEGGEPEVCVLKRK